MLELPKLIFDFFEGSHPISRQRNVDQLRQAPRTEYIGVSSRDQFLDYINSITRNDPFAIQIIAHGACDKFGLQEDPVTYVETLPLLRRINQATNNNLYLNLMTVCCSLYQLTFINHPNNRIFNTLIGAAGSAFAEGSILHSARLNNTALAKVRAEIELLNDQLSDGRYRDLREMTTYHIVGV